MLNLIEQQTTQGVEPQAGCFSHPYNINTKLHHIWYFIHSHSKSIFYSVSDLNVKVLTLQIHRISNVSISLGISHTFSQPRNQ